MRVAPLLARGTLRHRTSATRLLNELISKLSVIASSKNEHDRGHQEVGDNEFEDEDVIYGRRRPRHLPAESKFKEFFFVNSNVGDQNGDDENGTGDL